MELKRNTWMFAWGGILPAVLVLTGCNGLLDSFGAEKQDLHSVNDLSERVQSVHVESEISKERLRAAVGTLQSLTDKQFKGDPELAFESLVLAIDASEQQAKVLRKRVEPMQDSAERFFSTWSKDLDNFQGAELRRRSQLRMFETRKLYKQIEYSVEPAQAYYDELNSRLRDYATYLSNDFNAASVASLEDDVRSLGQLAAKLDTRFEECLSATQDYVASTGMYGSVGPTEPVVSSRD